MLDDMLTFSDHVTQNIQEALGGLRRLYQVEDLLQEPSKLHVYKLFIHSIYQYCYPAYGNSVSHRGHWENPKTAFDATIRCTLPRMLPMEAVIWILTCGTVHKVHTPYQERFSIPTGEALIPRGGALPGWFQIPLARKKTDAICFYQQRNRQTPYLVCSPARGNAFLVDWLWLLLIISSLSWIQMSFYVLTLVMT